MKRTQVTKRVYIAPHTKVVTVKNESPILANSPISGGHNDAEDDETLHAKQFNFDDEVGFGKNSSNLWEE